VSARRVVVRGRVQGVGFRYFAERAAREIGVKGFVRNLADGSVESVVEGDEVSVARYLEKLRQGPRLSRVDAIDVGEVPPQDFGSFEITG
jgi:acylphosphatase